MRPLFNISFVSYQADQLASINDAKRLDKFLTISPNPSCSISTDNLEIITNRGSYVDAAFERILVRLTAELKTQVSAAAEACKLQLINHQDVTTILEPHIQVARYISVVFKCLDFVTVHEKQDRYFENAATALGEALFVLASVTSRLKYALKFEEQLRDFMAVVSDTLLFRHEDKLWLDVLNFDYAEAPTKDYQIPCLIALLRTSSTKNAIIKFISAICEFSGLAFKELPSETATLMSRLSDSQDFGL